MLIPSSSQKLLFAAIVTMVESTARHNAGIAGHEEHDSNRSMYTSMQVAMVQDLLWESIVGKLQEPEHQDVFSRTVSSRTVLINRTKTMATSVVILTWKESLAALHPQVKDLRQLTIDCRDKENKFQSNPFPICCPK